ncbi:chaperone protein DNAj, putative [Trypanosoma equiperdum]|uniref:Chaperone protein DnaJ, putative n=2 Tax=Trypanozoon TaxID=39700 RepID=Q57WJ9_TRYB2|nr:chaperone protein DnaJ, putative [Trypanosoma brucei brucei TREU927]AAX70020.1 chaperone protein DnaJ, putative [Trypanosoma brucei]AAZ13588.1 chaperone protein DnaJ, putative [Trypanosoma brucei brucei TREU927]SCU66864.1 chaperone protein DNAj, putative [Trypanosoma equiperdum]
MKKESVPSKSENTTDLQPEGVDMPGEPLDVIGRAFSNRQPKHIGQGLADAVRNVAVGLGVGISSFIALPIAGGKREGATGVAKGIGFGLLGLAGGAAAGLVTGARQLGRGVVNTKAAVEETIRRERYWCSITGGWIEVRLNEMLADIPVTDDDIYCKAREEYRKVSSSSWDGAASPSGSEGNDPSEEGCEGSCGKEDYYSLIGVERTATTSQIRAAFHRKALTLHPDKNTGDAEATQRFQAILEAYNVLSNDAQRSEYDARGSVDINAGEGGLTSPIEQSLGATQLEPFIGRVEWAVHLTPYVYFDSELRKELKKRRVLRLAQNLVRFVDGDESTLESVRPLIIDAVSTRGGARLMPVVAQQYAAAARQHLTSSSLLREVDNFGTSKLAFLGGVADATVACLTTAVKAARKRLDGDEFLDTVLALCECDVQKNVLRAARLLFYDLSASAEQRNTRAYNLLKLSNMIKDICLSCSSVVIEAQ